MTQHRCRFCDTELINTFLDLGMSPLSNAFVKLENSQKMEPFYPLHAYVCSHCLLVQLPQVETSENIFSDYVYFSSYSDSWLAHSKKYVDMIVRRFLYHHESMIIEIASNDGYLLQYFKDYDIPVLGIEPAKNVAREAEKSGIPTITEFFGERLALELTKKGQMADLLIGNNVLAHVPDLNDFVKGIKTILNPGGIVTLEFPHLMRLMMENQFDTIYHEHFSYFSLISVDRIFSSHGLNIFDVDELPTHGGSLRIYACHQENTTHSKGDRIHKLLEREIERGFKNLDHYLTFSITVEKVKFNILSFLMEKKRQGKTIVGYGAPAKANTLLNFCGIRTDFLEYTVDRSPFKQGLLLPGTHIPIYSPDRIQETKPNYVGVLPWNLTNEIAKQMSHIAEWEGSFVTFIPEINVFQPESL